MSSNSNDCIREWTTDPALPDDSVCSKINRTRRNIEARTIMVPLFSELSQVSINGVPAAVTDLLQGEVVVEQWTETSNPFYNDVRMFGVGEDGAERASAILNDNGYITEYREETTQFKFAPYPTRGELAIVEVNDGASG